MHNNHYITYNITKIYCSATDIISVWNWNAVLKYLRNFSNKNLKGTGVGGEGTQFRRKDRHSGSQYLHNENKRIRRMHEIKINAIGEGAGGEWK